MGHKGSFGSCHTSTASGYIQCSTTPGCRPSRIRSGEVVDWNLWARSDAWRPFNQLYCDGKWRGQGIRFRSQSCFDWGAHTVEYVQWAQNKADDTMPLDTNRPKRNIALPLRQRREAIS